MIDEKAAAKAEGEALPESISQPVFAPVVERVVSPVERAFAAIEDWYAEHFHAAAVDGRPPITAEEKASLQAHVSDALTPKE